MNPVPALSLATTNSIRRIAAFTGVLLALLGVSAALPAVSPNSSPLVAAVAPQSANANAFTDYVGCITGVGVPIGTAWALAPYVPAIVRAVRAGSSPGSAVGPALTWAARTYGYRVYGACSRFIRS